ncbi:MAG: N-succinylarginine dihydrolase [Planctomycetota bacterium]|jgi:succinylarginine dihydrolase|nr:N-succinylarginine dihydrolase [Planctomycetota bacterium]
MSVLEIQLDGLPGPGHHYGGLAVGNLASEQHAETVSHPRAAARQCLVKMQAVAALGVPVYLLPPVPRPDRALLRAIGCRGSDAELLAAADPELLRIAWSSASMWTANAATLIPASDSADGRAHVVPANLLATPHRCREAAIRARQLRAILPAAEYRVHPPLPATPALADEGAANHTRLCGSDGRGCHLFVYGRRPGLSAEQLPQLRPARQTRAAQRAVARLAGLDPQQVHFARQHPAAIDAGAFHNDVVMVGCADRLLLHAEALVDQAAVLAQLRAAVPGLQVFEVSAEQLSLTATVQSYLFNSLLLNTEAGWHLLAPVESQVAPARAVIDRMLDTGFIVAVSFVDLGQSMQGGGGPACLRLRVPATTCDGWPEALRLVPERADALTAWIDTHYREHLSVADLVDPALAAEADAAQAALGDVLALGPELLGMEAPPC